MPRSGPRFVVAMLACAMTIGCTQDSPLGSSDPATAPRADLLRSAVRIHVDLARGTAVAVSPDARSATAAGLSFALVGRNELRADIIGPIRRSAVGQFTRRKVRVSMDVALTNLLTNAAFVVPTFPTPPAGISGVLLFPFATTVTAGSGHVAPSPDWNGAPINFFNDDVFCTLFERDCYRWEGYPAPLTGGSSTAAQTVGFDVDPSVIAFDTYFVLAADLSSLGVVAGRVTSAPTAGGLQTPAAGATVTLDLFLADGSGSLGHLATTTDANGNYRFTDVPPNSPFQPPFSAQNGNGYLLKVVAPVCGSSRDIDDSGMTAVQAGRTTNTNFIFNCS